MTTTTQLGLSPYTADIGRGAETFASLRDLQLVMDERVSGWVSSREWYARCRSSHGPKIRDARGKVVATVSYNGRLWAPSGGREEIVL
jgi:hypothetical protein